MNRLIFFTCFLFSIIVICGNTQAANATQYDLENNSSKINHSKVKIALIEQSFTNAAYTRNHFYNFYAKYKFPPAGTKITTDLQNLTSPLPHGPIIYWSQDETKEPSTPFLEFFDFVQKIMAKEVSYAQIDHLRDEDVHEGKIFDSEGKNLYDILVLFHQEYVSQQEYDNFKTFVENGGTIILAAPNVFTVEVKYSNETDSVTLVKGHDWEFDGKVAKPNVAERWVNETRNWAGSNFLTDPTFVPITFTNNPFNYSHTEEQYLSNPKDLVLLNYEPHYPPNHKFNPMVATYEFDYGKGKIISLSIWANKIWPNPKFDLFFENVIMPRAAGNVFDLDGVNGTSKIFSLMQTAAVSKIDLDKTQNIMKVYLEKPVPKNDALHIVLQNTFLKNYPDKSLSVLVNNKTVSYNHFSDNIETGLEIPLLQGASIIQLGVNSQSNTTFVTSKGNSTGISDTNGTVNTLTPFTLSTINGSSYTVTGSSNLTPIDVIITPDSDIRIDLGSGNGGQMKLTMPSSMISQINFIRFGQVDIPFYVDSSTQSSTTIHFTIPEGASYVEIHGALVVPEFSMITLVLAISVVSIILFTTSWKTILRTS